MKRILCALVLLPLDWGCRPAPSSAAREPLNAPSPAVASTAPSPKSATPDVDSRGCNHVHDVAADPEPLPDPPFKFSQRTIDRIARALQVSPECAASVAEVLSWHLQDVAEAERRLAETDPSAADSSVAERIWEETEARLQSLLSAEQISKLKLIPMEAPPARLRASTEIEGGNR